MNGVGNYRKREIQNLKFYYEMIHDIKLQLEAIEVRIVGVRSSDLSRVRSSKKVDIHQLYDKKEKLQKELLNYSYRTNGINTYLETLETNEKKMLTDIYHNNEKIDNVAIGNCISRETLKRRIKQILEK